MKVGFESPPGISPPTLVCFVDPEHARHQETRYRALRVNLIRCSVIRKGFRKWRKETDEALDDEHLATAGQESLATVQLSCQPTSWQLVRIQLAVCDEG
jgi:hypothetical protein